MTSSAVEEIAPLSTAVLSAGIRARHVPAVNGLRMHILEAGFDGADKPLVLLLHGFPELAYSWRKVMPALAAAGYHVVAPDQRGYGRTTGWSADYDADISSFRFLSLVRDALTLVSRLGHSEVHCVVGHDFGSPVAAWCALARPDVFRSVALMSAPFGGAAPRASTEAEHTAAQKPAGLDLYAALAQLPRPRKHYHRYYATRSANADMMNAGQGLSDFVRAYFHHKSADCLENKPQPLPGNDAAAYALLPTYYVMDAEQDMAQTVAPYLPSAAQIADCTWLPDSELAVFVQEYGRTGFQGGLNWYRSRTNAADAAELQLFAGRTIDVPSMFIAGSSDWGVYQTPGAFERMQSAACTDMRGCHLLPGAGHWVQQEQPEAVLSHLLDFLAS